VVDTVERVLAAKEAAAIQQTLNDA